MNRKAVEELSHTHVVKDMWDSFNDEEPRTLLMRFEPGVRYQIRLLGPFYKARRIYINGMPYFQDLISTEEFKAIVVGDAAVYEKVYARLCEKEKQFVDERNNALSRGGVDELQMTPEIHDGPIPRSHTQPYSRTSLDGNRSRGNYRGVEPVPAPAYSNSGYGSPSPFLNTQHNPYAPKSKIEEISDAKMTLNRLYQRSKWQRCVLVNALVLNQGAPSLKVLALNGKMTLNTKINGHLMGDVNGNIPLSGLNAHDLNVVRTGEGFDTQYEFTIAENPTHLSERDVNKVLSTGLADMGEVMKDINRHSLANKMSYFYRKVSGYKMPEELYSTLFKELGSIEEHKAAIDADDKLDDLPEEAFEDRESMSDPINCLEI